MLIVSILLFDRGKGTEWGRGGNLLRNLRVAKPI